MSAITPLQEVQAKALTGSQTSKTSTVFKKGVSGASTISSVPIAKTYDFPFGLIPGPRKVSGSEGVGLIEIFNPLDAGLCHADFEDGGTLNPKLADKEAKESVN